MTVLTEAEYPRRVILSRFGFDSVDGGMRWCIFAGGWKAVVLGLLVTMGPLVWGQSSPQPRFYRNQIRFAGGADDALVLDASVPMSRLPGRALAAPAVIVVHGGGWEAGDRRTYISPLLTLLESSPYAWFSVDYRLAPKHPYPAAVEDVQAAVAWVREHARELGVDSARLFLVGESSGGHLVSLVGALDRASPRNARLAGVVSFYGIHDFESWIVSNGSLRRNAAQFLAVSSVGPETLPRIREASPVNHIHARMPPYLLIHGQNDPGVPVAQSEEMCRRMAAGGASCELFVLPGAGHGMENLERQPGLDAWKPRLVEWLRSRAGE